MIVAIKFLPLQAVLVILYSWFYLWIEEKGANLCFEIAFVRT